MTLEDKELLRQEASNQRDATEEYSSFDELARGLADGPLTRGRVLKLMGATLLGSLGAFTGISTFADDAYAKKKKKGRQRRRIQPQLLAPPLPQLPLCPET